MSSLKKMKSKELSFNEDVEKVSLGNGEVNQDNLKSVAKNLLTRSSVYAVSQLVTSSGIARKFLWLLVLVFGLMGCSYEVYRFLTLYFQYPVVITLEVQNGWQLDFPAVTVCNLNRIPLNYYMCIKSNLTVTECNEIRCRNGSIERRISTNLRPILLSERNKFAPCSTNFDGVFSDEHVDQLYFLNQYLSLSNEDRYEAGYKADTFIESCSYNSESCSTRNFTNFQSIEFGNCFTFNAKSESNMKPLKTPYIGPNSGLVVTLNLGINDYSPLTSSIGARVVVHEPHAKPNPEDYGFNISPGFETSVSLQQRSIHRLPHPYRDKCKHYDQEFMDSDRNQEDCIRKCMQNENFQRCGCADPFLPADSSLDLCDLRNQTLMCCLDEVMKSLTRDATPCPCPLPCETTYYEMTTSKAEWPAFPYYKEFIKDPKPTLSPCNNDTEHTVGHEENYPEMKRTTAKLKVFYKTLENTSYKQEPMFQESELFSQLGGQLGLWLGVSLVALFECIENVSHLLHYCISKSGIRNKQSQSSSLKIKKSMKM
ncbi:hypothetical protein JTE90_021491 [Oedothorax gibbosus]|uniref:Uncharacterized protein n=1 Tax=Oedothorax gibbosus TaxID=931172 RepID=A0AAV6VR62_9ARAC|nr:hypothetical protein JTE90_021491 [Oedothorax gibbosus]